MSAVATRPKVGRIAAPAGLSAEALAKEEASREGLVPNAPWPVVPLGELAADERNAITDGPFGSKLKTDHYTDTGPRVIRLKNIGDAEFVDAKAHISEAHFSTLQKHRVFPGDIVIAALGENPPRSCLVPESLGPAIVKADCIRFKTGPRILPKFLNYVLNAPDLRRHAKGIVHGVGRPRLNLGEIKALPIPVPPLREQRRIVAEIEKQFTRLDAGIAALRRTQANLKRYRAAVLKAACEGRLVPTDSKKWKEGTLRDVLVGVEAGKSFKCEERPPTKSEIGVVKVSAVTWGTYDELKSKTCQDADRVEERYLVKPSDFLFSRANTIQLIGKCVIARKVTLRVMLSDKILRFHFSSAVIPSWILYWLQSDFGRREIERLSTGNQESMRNIGQERIRQIVLRFPPLAEQTRIVAEVELRLSVVEELETVVNANLQRSTRLRQSILQQAFAGS